MIDGHGDDAYKYGETNFINFSSNVYNHLSHTGLRDYLFAHFEEISHYPEPQPLSLEALIAQQEGIDANQVCVTSGATEAIYLLAQTFKGSNSAILQPTFSEYADACRLHAHNIQFFYNLSDLPVDARLVWICNPNNPTGELHHLELLQHVITQHPDKLFVLDQSYAYFTLGKIMIDAHALLYPNVVIIHSLTKRYAVPGLRIGYMVAQSSFLNLVKKQRMPWSVNQLAILAGQYLLIHQDEFPLDIPALLAERERVAKLLNQTGICEVWPSDTHYFLAKLRMGNALALKEYLVSQHHILIRYAGNFEGLDSSFFRIAVQLPQENNQLIQAIQEWIFL